MIRGALSWAANPTGEVIPRCDELPGIGLLATAGLVLTCCSPVAPGADVEPPVLTAAIADKNLTTVVLWFSDPLSPASVVTTNFEVSVRTPPNHRLSIVYTTSKTRQ